MSSLNSNVNPKHGRQRDPRLQAPRRTGLHPASGISRLASASSTANSPITATAATGNASRMAAMASHLSTSAPDASDTFASRIGVQRTRSYGSTSQTHRRPSRIMSGAAALDLAAAAGGSGSRRGSLTSTPLPTTTSAFRSPRTRSFLLSGAGGGGGNAAALGGHGSSSSGNALGLTFASLPKPQRTSKTSHRLVVLPSAVQTKPLILDEEQEVSDDGALPLPGISIHARPAPPKRITLPPILAKGAAATARAVKAYDYRSRVEQQQQERRIYTEEEEEIEAARPPLKRMRDSKSAAERMSKEDRKKAGHKRITAYCMAEGLKMKVLASFLKREHNVVPRVFDEALYVMYHLPLLPGYGRQSNIRSSAPPSSPLPSGPPGTVNMSKSILTRLEEAEENGYQETYFESPSAAGRDEHGNEILTATANVDNVAGPDEIQPFLQTHVPNMGGAHVSAPEMDPDPSLPGLVRPADVDEVREQDGYVTSTSLPRSLPRFEESLQTSNVGIGDYAFNPEYYNPYPSSSPGSEASSPDFPFHHTAQPTQHRYLDSLDNYAHPDSPHYPYEPEGQMGDVGITATSSVDIARAQKSSGGIAGATSDVENAALPDSLPLGAPGRDLAHADQVHPAEPTDTDIEDDAGGALTDPGVYSSWKSPEPQKKGRKSPSGEDEETMATTGGRNPLKKHSSGSGSERTARAGKDDDNISAAATNLANISGDAAGLLRHADEVPVSTDADEEEAAACGSSSSGSPTKNPEYWHQQPLQEKATHVSSVPSVYERELEYERERAGEVAELERLRQLEYERALERERERERERELDNVAEVVFFEYGVVVFFGLNEREERDILEDVEKAGSTKRLIAEEDWEVEECHFAHDPHIAYPRIYNDFFTLKSRSHLLKLSIAHALAQSTLLARYETLAQRTLSSPLTLSIPRQLASSGSLQLRRHEALKLTGRLFKLKRDVNLVSNVLDVPELFWSEASLKDLYDAVREYMEIDPRVESLNEKLGVASDFLDAIHDHLNNNAMERITRIIIWLIVVAILVDLGEIIARLIVHATMGTGEGIPSLFRTSNLPLAVATAITPLSKEEALRTLEGMMRIQS